MERLQPLRILLVEDDERLATILCKQFSDAGYSVDQTALAREAQALGRTEDYMAAVLDLGLPDGNGLEVLRIWRAEKIAMPVLLLTVASGTKRLKGSKPVQMTTSQNLSESKNYWPELAQLCVVTLDAPNR